MGAETAEKRMFSGAQHAQPPNTSTVAYGPAPFQVFRSSVIRGGCDGMITSSTLLRPE